jgi:hypothetical protein
LLLKEATQIKKHWIVRRSSQQWARSEGISMCFWAHEST